MINERKIITDLDLLSKRAEDINPEKEQDRVKQIILDLKAVIYNNDLAGLSAPQMGENVRIVALKFKNNVKAYVDPQLLGCGGMMPVIETDPSIPDKRYLLPRYERINVRALTPNGLVESFQLVGKASYMMQQLLDHLEGVFISDYGLEITDEFDKLTEEEKEQLIFEYMTSLNEAEEEINKQIDSDDTLKEMKDGIKFLESVRKGETQIEFVEGGVNEEVAALENDSETDDCEVHKNEEQSDNDE